MVKRDKPKGWGTLNPRGSYWEARICEQGKRVPAIRFATEEEGEDWLDERWKRIQRGHYVTPVEMTVRDLVEQYMEQRIAFKDWAPATENLNRRMARQHIYPTLGDIRLISVDPARIQFWVRKLAATLAPNTIKKCTTLLSGAYNQAVTLKVLTDNPCRHVQVPEPEAVEKVTWTAREVGVIDAALADAPFWLAVYRVMLLTGMRPGELRALTWSDIDFTEGRIRIRRTMTTSADGHIVVGKETKTKLVRFVALSMAARDALLGWQAAQVRRSLNANTDYVFASPNGYPLDQSNWRKYQHALIVRTGVTRLTLHGLRHTSATLDLASGTPVKVVSERLGHKDVAFTMRVYQHVSVDLQRSAADAMDELLYGKKMG